VRNEALRVNGMPYGREVWLGVGNQAVSPSTVQRLPCLQHVHPAEQA